MLEHPPGDIRALDLPVLGELTAETVDHLGRKIRLTEPFARAERPALLGRLIEGVDARHGSSVVPVGLRVSAALGQERVRQLTSRHGGVGVRIHGAVEMAKSVLISAREQDAADREVGDRVLRVPLENGVKERQCVQAAAKAFDEVGVLEDQVAREPVTARGLVELREPSLRVLPVAVLIGPPFADVRMPLAIEPLREVVAQIA
jgi:hypothetical protein